MKEKKNYWMIDGCDERFDTLRDAKNHTTIWTKKELEQYEGAAIVHYVGEDIVSVCTLHTRNGRPAFSKTWRVLDKAGNHIIPNHVL